MSRKCCPSCSCLQVSTAIVVLIEVLFLIYEAVMLVLLITRRNELKETIVSKLEENNTTQITAEQKEKLESITENVIIPIVLGVYIVIFSFSLCLTCTLIFGILTRRSVVVSIWICIVTVFLILNLIYLIPAIILVPDFLSKIEIVNVIHQMYRIVAVIVVAFYSKELKRRVVMSSRQQSQSSGSVYAVRYHIPSEQ